jgi:hypothetical protein
VEPRVAWPTELSAGHRLHAARLDLGGAAALLDS